MSELKGIGVIPRDTVANNIFVGATAQFYPFDCAQDRRASPFCHGDQKADLNAPKGPSGV